MYIGSRPLPLSARPRDRHSPLAVPGVGADGQRRPTVFHVSREEVPRSRRSIGSVQVVAQREHVSEVSMCTTGTLGRDEHWLAARGPSNPFQFSASRRSFGRCSAFRPLFVQTSRHSHENRSHVPVGRMFTACASGRLSQVTGDNARGLIIVVRSCRKARLGAKSCCHDGRCRAGYKRRSRDVYMWLRSTAGTDASCAHGSNGRVWKAGTCAHWAHASNGYNGLARTINQCAEVNTVHMWPLCIGGPALGPAGAVSNGVRRQRPRRCLALQHENRTPAGRCGRSHVHEVHMCQAWTWCPTRASGACDGSPSLHFLDGVRGATAGDVWSNADHRIAHMYPMCTCEHCKHAAGRNKSPMCACIERSHVARRAHVRAGATWHRFTATNRITGDG